MKTTTRKMSIFVFMAIATTTTLALGTSTAMAAKTHHVIQLKSSGDDWFPIPTTMTVSSTHTPHHNMHLMSSNGNHLTGTNGINSIGSRNNDIPAGWVSVFGPTQFGSTVSHSYHHHIPTGTIAGIKGANNGNDVNADFPTG
jgi:hypothetical protein